MASCCLAVEHSCQRLLACNPHPTLLLDVPGALPAAADLDHDNSDSGDNGDNGDNPDSLSATSDLFSVLRTLTTNEDGGRSGSHAMVHVLSRPPPADGVI